MVDLHIVPPRLGLKPLQLFDKDKIDHYLDMKRGSMFSYNLRELVLPPIPGVKASQNRWAHLHVLFYNRVQFAFCFSLILFFYTFTRLVCTRLRVCEDFCDFIGCCCLCMCFVLLFCCCFSFCYFYMYWYIFWSWTLVWPLIII